MKNFFFTRGSLAAELIEAGVEIKRVQNIYNPARPAWTTEFSREVVRIATDYYLSRGITVPQVLKDQASKYRKIDSAIFASRNRI